MATIDISRSLVRLRLPGSYFSFLHKVRDCESARVCESGRDRVYERRGMVYESVYECVCVYERVGGGPTTITTHLSLLRAPAVLAADRFLQTAGRTGRKKCGGAGYRSLCLLHAKQALYHLSYTPGGPSWHSGNTEVVQHRVKRTIAPTGSRTRR